MRASGPGPPDPISATPMRILVAIPQDFDSEFATNVLKSLIATWACAFKRDLQSGLGL